MLDLSCKFDKSEDNVEITWLWYYNNLSNFNSAHCIKKS